MKMKTYKSIGEFNIRLEARLKNSALIEAREKLGLTIQEVSNLIGISTATYDRFELMQGYPSEKIQKKICDFYRKRGVFLYEEDVFPGELRNLKIKGKYIAKKRIPVENLVSLSEIDERYLSSANENIEEDAERKDVAKSIDYILSTLLEIERDFISLFYGLSGSAPMPFQKIGNLYGVSGGSVRQLISRGIRKLRHPSRLIMFKKMLALPKRVKVS